MESKNFSIVHRLLHWSIALAILVLVVTALLRMTWFDKHGVGQIIQDNLQLMNISLDNEHADVIAKRIAKPMWDWHIYTGYALIGLYILRMIHLFANGMQFPNPFDKSNTLKQKAQGVTYIVFYILLGITTLTGFLLLFGPTRFRYTSEIIHDQSIYYCLAFIVMHFGGIIVTELFLTRGVASKMIHGVEE
ncbi:MAG: cytochrome b/b6 domain-containing protein [Bacteroidales bacterium]|nr:cytochrome b/b6 domain-containing protein [Bacteroidales bacterium]